jgi:hypothetical protein
MIESAKINKQVQEFLDKGIIRPSSSLCGSPIVLVPKKDSTWRTCTKFWALNEIMVKKHYPLPRIDDLLDRLNFFVYFTKLYLRSSHHKIRIGESDVWKTAFKTKHGLFEWLVMPFGLCNSSVKFMRVMNDVFMYFIDDFVIAYSNNILVFIRTWEDHVMDVEKVFELLKMEKLYVKMSKCEFGKTSHVLGLYCRE